jgi:hypothetical protein
MYKRFQVWLGVCCIAIFATASIGFPAVARLLLPKSFYAAAGVFLFLLPAALCSLLNFPWTISFLLFSRPRVLLAVDLVGLVPLALFYTWAARMAGALGVAAVTAGFALMKTAILQSLALGILNHGTVSEKPT